jgi:hypothetical protein
MRKAPKHPAGSGLKEDEERSTHMEAEATIPTLADLFPIPEDARKLERFIGNWTIEATLTLEGTPLRGNGTWLFERAAGGWGIRGRLEADFEGMGAYREDDLVGYDVETGTFHIYSLTNSSAVHDHLAKWEDGNTLVLEYDGLQEGKKYREEATCRFISDDEIHMQETDYVEGQTTMTMSLILRK